MNKVLTMMVLGMIMMSCGMGNFNKQKFTNLKKIKPVHVEEEALVVNENSAAESSVANQGDAAINDVPWYEIALDDSTKKGECDTLYFKSGKVLACKIVSESDEEIEFTSCPPGDSNYKVAKEDIVSTSGKKNEFLSDSERVVRQKEKFNKTKQTQPEYNNKHYKAARKFFRISLLCLGLLLIFVGLTILLGIYFWWSFWYVFLILSGLVYVIGMVFLSTSITAMKRFRMELGKIKFRELGRARSIRTLAILGLLLFGSVPFLIPFLLILLLANWAAKRTPTFYD